MQTGNKSRASAAKAQPRHRIAARVTLNPGAAPGSLNPLAGSAPAAVSVLTYTGSGFSVTPAVNLHELPDPADKGLRWVRVIGFGQVEPLLELAQLYGIRRLALEDILSPGWRTKLEDQGDTVFFLLQAPPEPGMQQKGEHLGLFCKHGLIVTFEETATRLVDKLWERLQKEPPPLQISRQAELLTYMLLDCIIDSFFPHLDVTDEKLAELEDKFTAHVPSREDLAQLHSCKRHLITLRRLLSPFREVLAELRKIQNQDSARELRLYLNDLNDHIVQAWELLDTYYEVAKSLDEISQTSISNRMNDIIKMLTLISTVFMPLSFVAGVYGMNFNTGHPLNMPELNFAYGYPLALLFMACIAGMMLWFFKKRNWL
jgi:magnesium transporter